MHFLRTLGGTVSLSILVLTPLASISGQQIEAGNGTPKPDTKAPGISTEAELALYAIRDKTLWVRNLIRSLPSELFGHSIRLDVIDDKVTAEERREDFIRNESGEMNIEREIRALRVEAQMALANAWRCLTLAVRSSAREIRYRLDRLRLRTRIGPIGVGEPPENLTNFRPYEEVFDDVRRFLSGEDIRVRNPEAEYGHGPPYAYYGIDYLMEASEEVLNRYRESRFPGLHEEELVRDECTRLAELREQAMRDWNALRESQEFRELSSQMEDLLRRIGRLYRIEHRLRELLSDSDVENILGQAELVLAACGGEGDGRKAQRPPKAEEPFNLSGTWVEMKKGKPVGEWEIRADERGKITLIEPLQNAPGKVIEYSGSIEGDTITVRHIIKDPELVDPKIPKKVIETAIQEYMPTWDLDLKVSGEGTIEGKKTGFLVTYDKKTQKVEKVKPRFENNIVLKKKGALAKGPTPTENCMESLRSFNREVQEYGRESQNFFDARDSLSAWQANFDFALRLAIEELGRARGEADADNPDSCEVRKREALRHADNVSTVIARRDVDSTFAQLLESHQNMSRRYNALPGRRQEIEDCLRQLERTENPAEGQVELMGIARTNLDSLNYIRPPELDWSSLDELREDMRGRSSGLREAISEVDCRWRMFERINRKLRALQEAREILEILVGQRPGEVLSPEELERIRAFMREPLPEELNPNEQEELRRRWESVYDNIRGRR